MMRSFRMFYRQGYLNYSEMYNCFMLKKAQFPPPKKKTFFAVNVQQSLQGIVIRLFPE